MLQTLIIDDEDHIRDSLTRLLQRHCPRVVVAGEAYSVATGLKAIQAFKFSAVDYLLKPVSPEELKIAVERVVKIKKKVC